MKKLILILSFTLLGCSNSIYENSIEKVSVDKSKKTDKIQVLNVGFFHFGSTSDATKVVFDENNAKEQEEIRELTMLLAKFKPTIICLEYLPEIDSDINKAYQDFLKNPSELITLYGELSMVGFDVARINGLHKVYGIDNHMGYNYSVGDFMKIPQN